MGLYKDKSKRHFRGLKTNVKGNQVIHPAYIVGEEGDNFISLVLTHSHKKGKHHRNHPLLENPDPNDSRQSYVRKTLEVNPKRWYTDWTYDRFRFSKNDQKYIESVLDKWEE